MTTGPNRDAVKLDVGTQDNPTGAEALHAGDQTDPAGSWVRDGNGNVALIGGGLIYWGADLWRDTALPEKWHLNADGSVDAGDK